MTSTREAVATDAEQRKDRKSFFGELPFLVLVAFVLALLLKTFVIQAFYIPSGSMEPTLEVGDRVLVNKLAYLFREPERGEVVVFAHANGTATDNAEPGLLERIGTSLLSGFGVAAPGESDFIKRIIGLPGDSVELRDGVVYVNGEELPEATTSDGGYLATFDENDFGPVTVEEGHYFMLGDNRPDSADSRFGLGQIARDEILGRAFVVIWPVSNFAGLPIAEYDPTPPTATTQ